MEPVYFALKPVQRAREPPVARAPNMATVPFRRVMRKSRPQDVRWKYIQSDTDQPYLPRTPPPHTWAQVQAYHHLDNLAYRHAIAVRTCKLLYMKEERRRRRAIRADRAIQRAERTVNDIEQDIREMHNRIYPTSHCVIQ